MKLSKYEFALVIFIKLDKVVTIYSKFYSIGILGQVWYLIVSIPDLCTLTYFVSKVYDYKTIKTCCVSTFQVNISDRTKAVEV